MLLNCYGRKKMLLRWWRHLPWRWRCSIGKSARRGLCASVKWSQTVVVGDGKKKWIREKRGTERMTEGTASKRKKQWTA
jgi:hypothetical protein